MIRQDYSGPSSDPEPIVNRPIAIFFLAIPILTTTQEIEKKVGRTFCYKSYDWDKKMFLLVKMVNLSFSSWMTRNIFKGEIQTSEMTLLH